MAAVMLAGAPLCNEAFAAIEISEATPAADLAFADGVKFIIKESSKFVAVTSQKVTDAETTYATKATAYAAKAADAAVFEVVNFKMNALGATFELKVNGQPFAMTAGGTTTSPVIESTTKDKVFTTFFANVQDGKCLVKDAAISVIGTDGALATFAGNSSVKSLQAKYDAEGLEEFNQSSTSFSFGADAVEGNVFQSLTPIEHGSGTIFVKGSADDITKWKADQSNKDKAAKLSVVYVKNEKWGLNSDQPGEGYKLVMVNGADFLATKDAAKWDNAEFSIEEGDKLNAEGEIKLSITPFVGENPTSGTLVTIAAVKASASDTKTYVTTIATGASTSKFAKVINPVLGDNTYFAASEFLSAGKSVYNIYFTSGEKSVKNGIVTEYHKYMAVTSNGTDFQAEALAANDVQLNSPFAQWIATGFDGKYTLTLTNRQTKQNVDLKLNATETAGVYKIVSASGYDAKLANLNDKKAANNDDEKKLAGKEIKLVKTTVTKTDGFLDLTKEEMEAKVAFKFSGKSNELGKTSFYAVPNYDEDHDTYDKLYPSQDENKITFYNIEKTDDVLLNVTNYAYLNADNEVVVDAADTLQVPVYNISYTFLRKDKKTEATVYANEQKLVLSGTASNALGFVFPLAMNGSYTMAKYNNESALSSFKANRWATGVVKDATINFATDDDIKAFAPNDEDFSYVTVLLKDNKDRTSLEAASRHATFEAVNVAGAVSFQENKKGILEGIIAAEPATFWLDTLTNGDEVSFYISKGIKAAAEETKADEAAAMRNFMYYANDSLNIFNEGSALATQNKNYMLEGTSDVKAIFRPATLAAHDSLVTVVDGKEKSLVKDALKAFQYGIVLADEEVAGEYVIYSKANPDMFLYNLNGKLGFTTDQKKALVVTLGEGDATANEAIAAENVAVIAGEGVVTVKGAAGKQVVVSNILGQVIANKVATSDEETIAVAAGVAVVVVDGEATKVVVK